MIERRSSCRGSLFAVLLFCTVSVTPGCGGSGGAGSPRSSASDPTPSGFGFDMWTEVPIRIFVDDATGGFSGARVQVVDALDEVSGETVLSGVYAIGVTDAQGAFERELRLPSARHSVDVIVHEPRHTGPYTHPRRRAEWGLTAPSSRITVSLAELQAGDPVHIVLEADQ